MTPLGRVLERTSTLPRSGADGTARSPGRVLGRNRSGTRAWAAAGTRATATAIRREWLACVFGVSALFAVVTALVSIYSPERLWGLSAAAGYAAATVAAAVAGPRGARLAVLAGLAGALAAPLAWMAYTGAAQPEVGVIVRSAAMFARHGTPYASPAALAAAHAWQAYDPYLPALVAFGLPRALAGGVLTDPRIWFGAAFVVTFGAAVAVARVPRPLWWTLLVTACPVVALPLAVGGDDLPVLGLMCLGLALAGREPWRRWQWPAAAGLAVGLAAAMKPTAWPAVGVVIVLLAARRGWRAVAWFALAALAVPLITDGPAVAAHPAAAMVNTVLYPLGLAKVTSPAASDLPGHILASSGAWGHWTALALMAAAVLGVGLSLLIRPPRDALAAGWRLATGLALLFVLAPASRAGYFVYPLGLAAWLVACRWPALPGELSVDPVPAHQPAVDPRGHD